MGARREAREALAAAGLRPRKRWGQHFLCDPSVARRIVDIAELGPRSVVLEIGPGLGALTEELAARAGRLPGGDRPRAGDAPGGAARAQPARARGRRRRPRAAARGDGARA